MATRDGPEIDRILLGSDDPSLRILGYGMIVRDFSPDQLAEGVRLNGEGSVEDALGELERGGHMEGNGDGTYHLPRKRFTGVPRRNEALELVHGRTADGADVYRYVCNVLEDSPVGEEAAVPASYLEEKFEGEDWRVELSPFVMARALKRCNYYDWDEMPSLIPGEAAEYVEGEELPVQVYELGDSLYRKAADEVVDFHSQKEEAGETAVEARQKV